MKLSAIICISALLVVPASAQQTSPELLQSAGNMATEMMARSIRAEADLAIARRDLSAAQAEVKRLKDKYEAEQK